MVLSIHTLISKQYKKDFLFLFIKKKVKKISYIRFLILFIYLFKLPYTVFLIYKKIQILQSFAANLPFIPRYWQEGV